MKSPDTSRTDTNSGDDSEGIAWGIEGNMLWLALVGLVMSVLVLLVTLSVSALSLWIALPLAAVPVSLALAFVVFKQTHPAGYERDLLDSWINSRGFGPRPIDQNGKSLFSEPANGFLVNDLVVFTQPAKYGYASKGFELEIQDSRHAPEHVVKQLQEARSQLLLGAHENQRIQFQWFCVSDFNNEFARYESETAKTENDWVRFHRAAKVARYREEMRAGKLFRQRLIIFVSCPIEGSPKLMASRTILLHHYQATLDQLATEFGLFGDKLNLLFAPHGVRVLPMTDRDHYEHYARFCNPSLADRPDFDPLETADFDRSIQENCWLSEGVGNSGPGFIKDGYRQAILVKTRWPKFTEPGIIHHLTHSRVRNLLITLNLEPLSVRAEIAKEERAYRRLRGDLASEGKVGLETVLEKKKAKVESLVRGFNRPFKAHFIIRIWARTEEELARSVGMVKQAINSMNGAQYFEPNLHSTTKRLYFQTWPGWLWGKWEHLKLYAELFLGDLIPFSSTFTGFLPDAEAIYDGPNHNVVGVKTYAGPPDAAAPQQAVLTGTSGSGKTGLLIDLLTQTSLYFACTVILDRGLSYATFTRTVDKGARPIIIKPNGPTINYLDSHQLPLTPEQRANVVALVSLMVGRSADEEKQLSREALISKYVALLYTCTFEHWAKTNSEAVFDLARLAYVLEQRRTVESPSLLERFVDFRDWQKLHPDEAQDLLRHADEQTVLKVLKDPRTRMDVQNLAYTRFGPAEYPQHRMLQELMHLDAATADREEATRIALQMLPWCRDQGHYGGLVDGETNVSLTGKIVHYELGEIPDSAPALMAVGAFLAIHHSRHHLFSLPRSLRKRVVYEEASELLSWPGAEKLLRESYETARKYNTWIVTVIAQYKRLKSSSIRAAVMGNSSQFFILKQHDDQDLNDLAADLGLSRSAVEAIRNYPMPGQSPKGAHFTYFHRSFPHPVVGTACNVASKEMLYVARSDGEHFEKRRKDLQGDNNNLLQRIVTLANQNETTNEK